MRYKKLTIKKIIAKHSSILWYIYIEKCTGKNGNEFK